MVLQQCFDLMTFAAAAVVGWLTSLTDWLPDCLTALEVSGDDVSRIFSGNCICSCICSFSFPALPYASTTMWCIFVGFVICLPMKCSSLGVTFGGRLLLLLQFCFVFFFVIIAYVCSLICMRCGDFVATNVACNQKKKKRNDTKASQCLFIWFRRCCWEYASKTVAADINNLFIFWCFEKHFQVVFGVNVVDFVWEYVALKVLGWFVRRLRVEKTARRHRRRL